jgi:chromosome segregation ATPase
MASDLGRIRQENDGFRHQIRNLKEQLKGKDSLAADVDRLNRAVMEREIATSIAYNELAHEKQRRQSEQDTNRRLTRSLRKKQEEIKSKEKEIDDLKAEVLERDKQVPSVF